MHHFKREVNSCLDNNRQRMEEAGPQQPSALLAPSAVSERQGLQGFHHRLLLRDLSGCHVQLGQGRDHLRSMEVGACQFSRRVQGTRCVQHGTFRRALFGPRTSILGGDAAGST
jgi:hypothetical protein